MISKYEANRKILKPILYFILIFIGLIYIFPFFWMVISSFKFNKDVLAIPLEFFPPEWNFSSYPNFMNYPGMNFPKYFLNSTIVLILSVFLAVLTSLTAGYGFAKYKFKGNNFLFTMILSTLMIPFQAIAIPLFIMIRAMNLQNTYPGLFIPMGLTAFGIFLMRQFMVRIPNEIIEAARIDGASEFKIFINIIIPLSKTPIIALVIFHSQWVWNMLLWPLIVASNSDMRTLPQGIALLSGLYSTPYPEQLAASVSACLPLIILYILLSKYFVKGIALTGLKE